MEINERIKCLRKNYLHLSQEDFAARLKISRGNLSNIEINRVNITDRVISDICREFNVNEEWLRTGVGGSDNIFHPDDVTLLLDMGKLADSDNRFKKFCVETLMNAPDEFFDYIYKEFLKFENEKKGKE